MGGVGSVTPFGDNGYTFFFFSRNTENHQKIALGAQSGCLAFPEPPNQSLSLFLGYLETTPSFLLNSYSVDAILHHYLI